MQDSIMVIIGFMVIFGTMLPASIVLWLFAWDEVSKRWHSPEHQRRAVNAR